MLILGQAQLDCLSRYEVKRSLDSDLFVRRSISPVPLRGCNAPA